MFNKSTLFLIVLILPIALSSDLYSRLENTAEGQSVLNTLLIQTKLQGITADAIKTVLSNSQKNNDNSLEKFNEQSEVEKKSCEDDLKSLKSSISENVSKRFSIEKTLESTNLLRDRKTAYVTQLDTEIADYEKYENEVTESVTAWTNFFESMENSIKSALENLVKIRVVVERSNPQNAASFAQTQSKEAAIAEIRSNLEFRFYDTIGMKPILSNLLEVVSKDVSSVQFYKVSKTLDMIENFLVNRRNNLIEDNEFESQYSTSLKSTLSDSRNSITFEKTLVSDLVSSLDTRVGLLNSSLNNAKTLVSYAENVYNAREKICSSFESKFYSHVRRYSNVRLTIAELYNSLDDEYRDFTSFLQKRSLNEEKPRKN